MSTRHFCDVCKKARAPRELRRFQVTTPPMDTIILDGKALVIEAAADVCNHCLRDWKPKLHALFGWAPPIAEVPPLTDAPTTAETLG